MAKADPYICLGVGRDASPDEIKRAYRRLARRHHPDMNGNSHTSQVRFREVSEAYEILSDAEKRGHYDRFGHEGLGEGFAGFGNGQRRASYGADFGGTGFGFGFNQHTGAEGFSFFDEVFSEFLRSGNARRPRRSRPARGSDLDYSLTVDFEEAYRGTWVNIRVMDTRLEVHIPAGVETGTRVRVQGQGARGLRGGAPGDLYLTVAVRAHRFFRREGNDIHAALPITFGEAVLGARVELPGPDGRLALRIPPGTKSGTVFRFREKGFPDLKDKTSGDFYVTVEILVPDSIDAVSRDLVLEFERLNPVRPREGL